MSGRQSSDYKVVTRKKRRKRAIAPCIVKTPRKHDTWRSGRGLARSSEGPAYPLLHLLWECLSCQAVSQFSSPRHIAPSVRISRTGRTCLLHVKSYVTRCCDCSRNRHPSKHARDEASGHRVGRTGRTLAVLLSRRRLRGILMARHYEATATVLWVAASNASVLTTCPNSRCDMSALSAVLSRVSHHNQM